MEASIFEERNQVQDKLTRFGLVEGVELFTGLNDVPMLYLSRKDKYVRLSPLGADVITMFEAYKTVTKEDLEGALVALYPRKQNEIAQKVSAFLAQLERIGAIRSPDQVVTPEEYRGKASIWNYMLSLLIVCMHFIYERPMLRISLWHPDRLVADRLFSRLRASRLGRPIMLVACVWLVIAIIVAGYSTIRQGMFFNSLLVVWPLVIVIYLLHMLLHELCHVIVGSYFKVKIRTVGVGLLYYVLPFFYMDRSDSYRLRSSKHHMYIALAGPAFDITAATLSAIIMNTSTGWLKATFHVLLLAQTVTFMADINPLLPTDGYRALESALKEINLRQRAFQTLACVFTRKQLPPHLITQSAKARSGYLVYGSLAMAWTAFLVSYVAFWYLTTGASFLVDWILLIVHNISGRLG